MFSSHLCILPQTPAPTCYISIVRERENNTFGLCVRFVSLITGPVSCGRFLVPVPEFLLFHAIRISLCKVYMD